VPTYIAAMYVMYYYKDFKLVSAQPRRDLYSVDTVKITARVSLKHISQLMNIPMDELQFLNPSLKTGIIPLTESGYSLNIPISYIGLFEALKTDIMNDTSLLVQNYIPPVAQRSKTYYYKVKAKETLSYVAAKFGVTVNAIKQANNLKSNSLYTGQQLKIIRYTAIPAEDPQYAQVFAVKPIVKSGAVAADTLPVVMPDTSASATTVNEDTVTSDSTPALPAAPVATADTVKTTPTTLDMAAKLNAQCNCIYHVVQPGDTLWNIAQRYNGLTVDKLKADNQDVVDHPIKPGDVLKIFR
jgi:membrane-bound lytic murein transglycosylase D